MARAFGKVYASMWAEDEHFLSLGKDAKLAYNYLLGQGDLGHAGVIALRVNPWARDMSMTVQEAHAALSELHNERFVVIDQDEMLLLVRSLIRRDGVHKQPNVFKAAVDQIYNTRSMPIRRALLAELERLNPAEFKGDSELLRAEVVAWLKKVCENPPPNPSGKGFPKGSEQNGDFGHGFDISAGKEGSANPSGNPQRAHAPTDARVSPTPTTATTPTASAPLATVTVLPVAAAQPPTVALTAEPAALFECAPAARGDEPPVLEPVRNSGTLIAEWVDYRASKGEDNKPTEEMIKRVGAQLKKLLKELSYDTVRQGFIEWDAKSGSPTAIPSFVNQVQGRRARGADGAGDAKPSAATLRTQAGMGLMQQFAAEEGVDLSTIFPTSRREITA